MINREASDKTKGFRLQKLRAVKLMLEAANFSDSSVVYWAIEHMEDLYEYADGEEYFEEDKNYDKDSSFTFNNPIFRNTLVSFIDIWFAKELSLNLKLGFYATNKIGKESITKLVKKYSIELPDISMIELCKKIDIAKKSDTEETKLLEAVRKFMLHEYESQYSTSNNIFKELKKWSNDEWKHFLSIIDWGFEQKNEEELQNELFEKIKNCKWYSYSEHNGKEEFIISRLIDLLDERQSKKDYLERFVHMAEVEMTFLKIASPIIPKENDGIWQMWDKIDNSDNRNIKDKLLSVCKTANSKLLGQLIIEATEGGIERQTHEDNKDFLAMRYRVYSRCRKELNIVLENSSDLPESDIKDIIAKLKEVGYQEAKDFEQYYKYPVVTSTFISNIIIELFDSCYLAFDNVE